MTMYSNPLLSDSSASATDSPFLVDHVDALRVSTSLSPPAGREVIDRGSTVEQLFHDEEAVLPAEEQPRPVEK
jgi:hypothetical protein